MQILIIGSRRKCYEAALRLGFDVLLWSDGPLSKRRKKALAGSIELPFAAFDAGQTQPLFDFLAQHPVKRVIGCTEASVLLAAKVRRHLGLKSLAEDVTARFSNKFTMKNCAREAGIPTTDYRYIGADVSADALVSELGLPLVIKPLDSSGARDVKVCRSAADVEAAMQIGSLAEAFVEGTELSVETLVNRGEPIFHNLTEYLHQWKKSVAPAQLEPSLHQQILELNDRVIAQFGVDRGMTHAEFYLTAQGPLFGEIALRPPGGYYMDLIARVYGFDPWEAFVNLCCGRPVGPLRAEPDGFAAVVTFHPGRGRIRSIEGEQQLRDELHHLMDLSIRAKPGDDVGDHSSTSSEVAHLLFWEPDRPTMMRSIALAEASLNITLEDAPEA